MDENKWSFAKAVARGYHQFEPRRGAASTSLQCIRHSTRCGFDGWCVVEQDLFPVKSFDVPLEKATIGRENLRKAGF